MKINLESEFAPTDDVIAALESIPGINDSLTERMVARENGTLIPDGSSRNQRIYRNSEYRIRPASGQVLLERVMTGHPNETIKNHR